MKRLQVAAACAGIVFLGCHEAPTTPAQRFESGPTPGFTTTVGSFTLRELGTIGGVRSGVYDVNDSGDMAGASTDSSGVLWATLWPADGSAPRVLPQLKFSWGSSGTAINAAGDIAGDTYLSSGYRATFWPGDGGAPRDLGALPGASGSAVRGMNDAGDVVGDSYFPSETRATLWPASGGPPRDLGPGSAMDINSAGVIVGSTPSINGRYQATLWLAGGGAPQPLTTLPEFWSSWANGINDAGDVVGSNTSDGLGRATLWPAGGAAPRILGEHSAADDINDAGDIVGWSFVPAGEMHASLWAADGSGMQDLGTLDVGHFAQATAINSARRIVGVSQYAGYPEGDPRAVVWEPITQQPQSITFASSPPNGAIVGGAYTVSATGGGSGNPVTFTSLTPAVCSVAGSAVNLDAGGRCAIAADQAGSAGYLAAPQVTQSFDINTRPVASAGTAHSGNEGSTITFSAANSSDADGDAIIAYTWDFGDGTVQSVTSPTVEHIYSDNKSGGGGYLVTLQVTDSKGATSSVASTSAQIDNIAPSATFDPISPVGEGTVNLSLTGVEDAPGDLPSLAYAFDCGDGAGYGAFSSSASIACTAPDDGAVTVRAKIKDKDGAESEYAKSVTVVNVAPSIAIITAPASGKPGAYYTLQFRVTDPGTLDAPWAIQTIWGDGKNPAAPSLVSAQGQTITQTYRYNKVGTYIITVRVTDRNGATAIVNVPVTIVR